MLWGRSQTSAPRLSQRLKLLAQAVLRDAGSDDGVFHFAVLEEQEGRDGLHAVLLRELSGFVDIHLAHFGNAFDFTGDGVNERGYAFAGATPLCPEVYEDWDRRFEDFSLEIIICKLQCHAETMDSKKAASSAALVSWKRKFNEL